MLRGVRLSIAVVMMLGSAVSADAPKPDAALRAVPWCDRGYGATLPTLSRCRGSVEQRHRAGEGIWGFEEYRFASVTYGDLTGDGNEDALVVLETSLRPVLLPTDVHAPAPSVRAEMWLVVRRGADLVIYTTESAETVPVNASIANGVATLVWRDRGKDCDETWRFGGEGRTATKSARHCK